MSKILQLSDKDMAVSYSEQGSGEPLVLIHGVGMQLASWQPQIDFFAKSHRVIAVDMPGHGDSDLIAEGSSLSDYVEWFHGFIKVLDIEPVNIAGHSMGALIACGFSISYSQLVRRVAMLNGVHRRSASARSAVMSRAKEIAQGNINFNSALDRWFGDSPHEPGIRDLVENWLYSVNLKGYATAYNAFAQGDDTYADKLSEISCPLLALTADGDPNSTPEMSIAIAELAQDGQAKVINGQRHMVNLTAADVVNQHLREWLNRPISSEYP